MAIANLPIPGGEVVSEAELEVQVWYPRKVQQNENLLCAKPQDDSATALPSLGLEESGRNNYKDSVLFWGMLEEPN